MRVPEALEPLYNEGLIQQVVRPLMAGKEAQVYLVIAGDIPCVAKVYKEATRRSFQHRTDYTEGRRVRNSRQQRAMDKGSRFGREQVEQAWRSAEVDAIYRLRAAGVRVPEPYSFVDGVLVMELITDRQGGPAPRMADQSFSDEDATALFHHLVREVCRMLCAGIIHGDLSDFNVLMSGDGPVIIDFPQAIDPAANRNARKLLIRDVDNLTSFLGRYAPALLGTQYGAEIWDLYERGVLTPESPLTGKVKRSDRQSDIASILREIEAAEHEARARREALGLPPPRLARAPVYTDAPPPRPAPEKGPAQARKGRPEPSGSERGGRAESRGDGDGSRGARGGDRPRSGDEARGPRGGDEPREPRGGDRPVPQESGRRQGHESSRGPQHESGRRPERESSRRPDHESGHRTERDPGRRPERDPGHRRDQNPGHRPDQNPGHRPDQNPGHRPDGDRGRRPDRDSGRGPEPARGGPGGAPPARPARRQDPEPMDDLDAFLVIDKRR